MSIAAWLLALGLALAVGVLIGVATGPHVANRKPWEWTIGGLVGAVILFVVLGGCVYHRSDKSSAD